MKKEILTAELKKSLALISGKDCPYLIYAFKAAASGKHGDKHPFIYLSNGYKERFKDKPVELVRVGLFEHFSETPLIRKEDLPYIQNFINNNFAYIRHMWNGDSLDDSIAYHIKKDWSLTPAKERFTGELSYQLTWFPIGPYEVFFYTPMWNMYCAPFVYFSNGPRCVNVFKTELVRFSTNGNLISDVDLKIKEDDLPKIRRFILANKELIIKAWYGPYTRTDLSVICDELKRVWE